jgi:hypothetical protein
MSKSNPKGKKEANVIKKRMKDQRYRDKNRLDENWRKRQNEKNKRCRDKKKANMSQREKNIVRRSVNERKRKT